MISVLLSTFPTLALFSIRHLLVFLVLEACHFMTSRFLFLVPVLLAISVALIHIVSQN